MLLATSAAIGGAVFAADDDALARCRRLADYVNRYEYSGWSQRDTGVRLRADAARKLCEAGDTRQGIAILEREARRGALPVPP